MRRLTLQAALATGLALGMLMGCQQSGSNAGGTGAGGSRAGSGGSGGRGGTGGTAGGMGATGGGVSTGGAGATGGAATGGAGGSAGGGATGGSPVEPPRDAPPTGSDVGAADVPSGPVAFPQVTSFDSEACHDLDIAVSPTLVGVATNPGVVYFYDKTGKLSHKVAPYPGGSVGDSHLVWDDSSKRWFFSSLQGDGGSIAVSRDETGRTWTAPAVVMTDPDMDNPNLGVTADKVILQNYGCLYTMDKDVVMAGTSRTLTPMRNCGLSRDDQIYGVDNGSPVPSTAYFVDLASGRRSLNWISVEGTPKAGNVVVTPHMLPVKTIVQYPVFPGVPQPGGTRLRNSGVCAEWHAGTLAWAKGVKCGELACARAFVVDTGANTLREFDFSLPELNVWSAAPGIDRKGNVWFYMAVSSETKQLSLALAGVSAGGAVIPPKIVVNGTAPMDAGSFGDFFDGAQDPADGSVWFVGHYGTPKPSGSFCMSRVAHVVAE
jgi:hypothetical protein